VIALGPAAVERWINNGPPAERERRRRRIYNGLDEPEAQAALRIYDRFLADMETQLARTPWLAGDRFSLAEVNVIPFVNRLDMLALSGMWTQSRPRVTDWWERIKARPTFQDAMFKYVPPPLRRLMAEKGEEAWPKVSAILAGG
jgi:glutathione S-transferase